MYDSYTGRFMQEDPTGFDAGDLNLYRYVGNSPTNATDPTGMEIGLVFSPPVDRRLYVYFPNERPLFVSTAFFSPDETLLINALGTNPEKQKALVNLLNKIHGTWVFPSLPLLGAIFYNTLGSQCVRWTNAFLDSIRQINIQEAPARFFYIRQYTLRYPLRGGPEHSIILIRPLGDVNPNNLFGIDNGALGGWDHIFVPQNKINDSSLPDETREDMERAINEHLGR